MNFYKVLISSGSVHSQRFSPTYLPLAIQPFKALTLNSSVCTEGAGDPITFIRLHNQCCRRSTSATQQAPIHSNSIPSMSAATIVAPNTSPREYQSAITFDRDFASKPKNYGCNFKILAVISKFWLRVLKFRFNSENLAKSRKSKTNEPANKG